MRFQPIQLLCVSDLWPSSARNGAEMTGKAIITATTLAGTAISTIITRFNVPKSNTAAMPKDT